MKLVSKISSVCHFIVSMFLINSKKYSKTYFFQLIKVKIAFLRKINTQVKYFLHEYHEVMDIKHYNLRNPKHYCCAKQFENTQ